MTNIDRVKISFRRASPSEQEENCPPRYNSDFRPIGGDDGWERKLMVAVDGGDERETVEEGYIVNGDHDGKSKVEAQSSTATVLGTTRVDSKTSPLNAETEAKASKKPPLGSKQPLFMIERRKSRCVAPIPPATWPSPHVDTPSAKASFLIHCSSFDTTTTTAETDSLLSSNTTDSLPKSRGGQVTATVPPTHPLHIPISLTSLSSSWPELTTRESADLSILAPIDTPTDRSSMAYSTFVARRSQIQALAPRCVEQVGVWSNENDELVEERARTVERVLAVIAAKKEKTLRERVRRWGKKWVFGGVHG